MMWYADEYRTIRRMQSTDPDTAGEYPTLEEYARSKRRVGSRLGEPRSWVEVEVDGKCYRFQTSVDVREVAAAESMAAAAGVEERFFHLLNSLFSHWDAYNQAVAERDAARDAARAAQGTQPSRLESEPGQLPFEGDSEEDDLESLLAEMEGLLA